MPDVGPAAVCITPPTPAGFPSGPCYVPQPQTPDSFDEALAAVGLTRCTVTQNPSKMPDALMSVNDPRQLPDFKSLLQYPLRLPDYGTETATWLDTAMSGQTPVASAIAAAAARIGKSPSICPDPSWFMVDGADVSPLTTALGNMASAYGASFDPAGTTSATAALPVDLQRALAVIVNALSAAGQTIQTARSASAGFMNEFLEAPDWVRALVGYAWTTKQLAAWDGIDVGGMAQAALWVATAVEAVQLPRFAGVMFDPITLSTPLGNIVLHGAGNDDYEPNSGYENALFLLDTGGNDMYNVPVAATTETAILSIAVDLGGSDTYGYLPVPSVGDNVGHRLPSDAPNGRNSSGASTSRTLRQGAALLGVGMMWDYGTDGDTYRSLVASQGVGVFGVGVLYDEGGDDDYAAESLVQGGAAWGIGLLLDGAGNDKYLAYNSAMGFGFTQGLGALVDEGGNDSYYCDPGAAAGGDSLYPSAQGAGAGNVSMCQGAGEGHRPDAPDPGYPFAGGMGILRDAHGADSYVTSVFGQASGFAMGIGMLLEGDGDDTYAGFWYVQGAAAHTSVAYFDEQAGNDQYNVGFPVRATSIGVGHDYSAVLHYDQGGDDQYHGPQLSLGSGNDNGVGLMLVVGGNDTFLADTQAALGVALDPDFIGTVRASVQTLGVFVKASCTGTYTITGTDAAAYAQGSWSYAPENALDGGGEGEKSIGIDRPSGSASWP